MSYRIVTDSGSDIKREILKSWGVEALSLSYKFTDSDEVYDDSSMPISDFYAEMKAGRVAKTSAVNAEAFRTAFDRILSEGEDVLYLGFSSGLSSTYSAAHIAAAELREKYPERRIITVDTLAASAGQGLLVYLAAEKQRAGESIEAVAEYAEGIKQNVCHWFTVEDLVYLKRGGRISAAAALFGNMLGIKPVLHVDSEGHLTPVEKVRGRRTSLNAIVDRHGATALDPAAGPIFISHASCETDVQYVASEVERRYGAKVTHVTDVGPVIGSHAGPGTLAFFFVGKER